MPAVLTDRGRVTHLSAWYVPILVSLGLGALAGLVWWITTPTYQAVWTSSYWYSPTTTDFWVRQDVGYGLTQVVLGVGMAIWLLARRRPGSVLLRYLVALTSAVLGAVTAWGLGLLLGHTAHPAAGEMATAPLQLHSLGLLGTWPALMSIIVGLALALTGLWSNDPAPPSQPDLPGEQ